MLQKLRNLVATLLPSAVQPVFVVNDPVMTPGKMACELVVLIGANVPTPLRRDPRFVRSVKITAGPRADGTTPNAATLFLGTREVAASSGEPLPAGAWITLVAVDLRDVYILGSDAADVARLLIFT